MLVRKGKETARPVESRETRNPFRTDSASWTETSQASVPNRPTVSRTNRYHLSFLDSLLNICVGSVPRMNRRKFLRQSALAAGALAASRLGRLALPPSVVAQVGVTRKRVIVVGAGLAGLVAAYELTPAGHDVSLLQASTRPRGRLWALREAFSDGLYAGGGRRRVSRTHHPTLEEG